MIKTLIAVVNENSYHLSSGEDRGLEGRRVQASRAIEARAPISGFDAFHPNFSPAARRVEEAALAEVNANVRIRSVARVVKDQIARLELLEPNRSPDFAQAVGIGGQQHAPRALEDIRDETAAIEAGLRRASAVAILHPDELQRLSGRSLALGNHALAQGPRGR